MRIQRQVARGAELLLAGAIGAGLLAVAPQVARADDDSTVGQKTNALRNTQIDVEFAGAPLSLAIRIMETKLPGLNIVFINQMQSYLPVTLSLRSRPVVDVLNQIAVSAGADFWQKDGVCYIGPKGSAPAVDLEANKAPVDNTPAPVVRRREKIRLNFTDVHSMLRRLGVLQNPASGDDRLESQAWRNMLHDGSSLSERAEKLSNLTFRMMPGANNLGQNYAAPSVNTSGTRANATQSGDDGAAHRSGDEDRDAFGRGGQVFGGAQAGGFGGQPSPGGGAPGVPGNGQPGGVGTGLDSLLPDGIKRLIANPADNSIIVFYENESDLAEFRQLIRLLDVKPRQIMIRSQLVTTTQLDAEAFGLNLQFQKVNLVGSLNAGFSPTGNAILQFATGNFQTQINLALSQNHGKVVSSPMATTLNGLPATFSSNTTFYAFIPITTVGLGGTTQTQYIPTAIPVTTQILIIPLINGDDSITLSGFLEFSDQQGTATSPDGTSIPIIIQQQVPVRRILRDGDTMAIAGFIRKTDSNIVTKVPLLGDLPIIGTLFRSKSITTNDSELIVFITPNILPELAPRVAPGGGVDLGGVGAGGGLANP